MGEAAMRRSEEKGAEELSGGGGGGAAWGLCLGGRLLGYQKNLPWWCDTVRAVQQGQPHGKGAAGGQ